MKQIIFNVQNNQVADILFNLLIGKEVLSIIQHYMDSNGIPFPLEIDKEKYVFNVLMEEPEIVFGATSRQGATPRGRRPRLGGDLLREIREYSGMAPADPAGILQTPPNVDHVQGVSQNLSAQPLPPGSLLPGFIGSTWSNDLSLLTAADFVPDAEQSHYMVDPESEDL